MTLTVRNAWFIDLVVFALITFGIYSFGYYEGFRYADQADDILEDVKVFRLALEYGAENDALLIAADAIRHELPEASDRIEHVTRAEGFSRTLALNEAETLINDECKKRLLSGLFYSAITLGTLIALGVSLAFLTRSIVCNALMRNQFPFWADDSPRVTGCGGPR